MDEHDEKPAVMDRLRDAKLETLGEFLDQLGDDGAMNMEELDLLCRTPLLPSRSAAE